MNVNKQTTIVFICIAVALILGIGFVMTRKSDIEAEKPKDIVAGTDTLVQEPAPQKAELTPDKPADKPADKSAEKPVEQPVEKAAEAPKTQFDQQAADETRKLEKSLGIKSKDALARTLNYNPVAGKQITTILFIAQDKTYKLDVANAALYSCKLAFPATYFKINRAVLGTKDVLTSEDVHDIYVYGTDTSKSPALCKLN